MKRFKFLLTALFSMLLTLSVVTACNSSSTNSNALIMATSADYPPYEFIDSSSGKEEIIGFDVDIAKYIAEKNGKTLQINNIDFNGLIPALQAKRADLVMAGMTPTEERKKSVDFSEIYYEAKNTIVAKKGAGLATADNLKGKKVGVQLGSIQQGIAEKMPGITMQPLNKINEMVQEIKAGRIEAAIIEDTVAKGYIAANPDLEFNVLPNEEAAGSAIAFPKGSPLPAQFNPVLQEMKSSGKLEELVNKWFGEDSPALQKAS
ncbi:MAG: transporter substrate-binding domain-containing protein [Timaviella obliquedivisa GSE-PSE-MK23-08B]|jgi:polar amino acid transport system substrate-binding protein|nr:transporter substrate-binding domain-containing protein [Timaviella obliquedivisa GSE-PSE-MK23-08B]